jgi:hypothetical protein
MRHSNQNVHGGNILDVESFTEMLFDEKYPKDVSHEDLTNKTESIPERHYPGNIRSTFNRYELSHAYIACYGHAIAGYRTKGNKYMIFDSNFPRPFELNWQKNPQLAKKYLADTYGSPGENSGKFHVITTYIKYVKTPNVNKPPEMRFNNGRDKSLYRYSKQGFLKLFKKHYSASNFKNSNRDNLRKYLNANNVTVMSNLTKIVKYVSVKNLTSKRNDVNMRVILRRQYRNTFGTNAPSNMTNSQIYSKIVNKKYPGIKFVY